jgi:hypothetical protein
MRNLGANVGNADRRRHVADVGLDRSHDTSPLPSGPFFGLRLRNAERQPGVAHPSTRFMASSYRRS